MGSAPLRLRRAAWVRDSFWLVPALCGSLSVMLAVGLSFAQLRLGLPVGGVLPSTPAGARSLLSSIITAMISFTALVFSITIVVIQLAASQYSPRILRTFQEDRIIQGTLGTFVATFLFAMVVLATLPGDADAKLPELSLAVAILLVALSTAIFVYYLHHVTTIMRIAHTVAAIGAQTRADIKRHHLRFSEPPAFARPAPVDRLVLAPRPGVLAHSDLNSLAVIARRYRCAVSVLPNPGDFVPQGAPVLAVHRVAGEEPRDVDPTKLLSAITLGPERVHGQDIAFGFRQLADIAERALSPGVNDVTTAVRAVQESHDLLRHLAARPQPSWWVVAGQGGVTRVYARRQTLDSFLAVAVDDVLQAGQGQPRITTLLAAVLADLATVAPEAQRPAINRRLTRLRELSSDADPG